MKDANYEKTTDKSAVSKTASGSSCEKASLKIKKLAALLLCLIIFVVPAAACGKETAPETTTAEVQTLDPSLFGTWHEDYYDSGYIFNEDGTGSDTFWDLDFTYTIPSSGRIHVVYTDKMWGETDYTYSVENDTLKIKLKDSDIETEYTRR